MDTYGDMVTLLLCFFVLLYSMSTIDEAKMKAIIQSFNPKAIPTMTDPDGRGGPFSDPELGDKNPGLNETATAQQAIDDMMKDLYQAIKQMISDEGMESTIQVEMEGGTIYIHFRDTVFFLPDDFVIQAGGREVLGRLCALLIDAKDAIDVIQVEGYTAQAYADRPNEPWGDYRLSFNRAVSVLMYIQENSGIHPARLVPVGMGQWRPISSNKTPEGRIPNRRVEMIISGVNLDADAFNEAMNQYINLSDGAEKGAENP